MASTLDRRSLIRTASRVLPASVAGLLAACTDENPAGAVIALRLRKVGNAGVGNCGYGPLDNDQGILLLPGDFSCADRDDADQSILFQDRQVTWADGQSCAPPVPEIRSNRFPSGRRRRAGGI